MVPNPTHQYPFGALRKPLGVYMLNEKSHKCTNCGKEIWLGAFFDGYFLCELCHQNAAYIIFRLKKRLTKRVPDVAKSGDGKSKISGKRPAKSPRR